MASGPSPASSVESDSTTTSLDDLTKVLEQIIRDVHDALNKRQLDPDSYPWTVFEADFKCEAAYTVKYTTNIRDYLLDVGGLFVRNPNLRYDIEDITVHVSRTQSRGDILINHATSGWPMGIVRRSVGIAHFRLLNDKWKIVSYKQAAGYGPF